MVGHMLRGGSGEASAASKVEGEAHGEKEAGGDHAPKEKDKDAHGGEKKAKKDDHGASSSSSGSAYFKFSREFVVPIIQNERVASLVILNINIESDAAMSDKLFSQEPVIRDVVMTTLIEISGDGKTFQSMTSIENYETLRSLILGALQKKFPDMGIKNILILDIARQDL
ncbi:hypothetical protein HNE_0259 [Hyphomonas neptunium ATCC 15444]|uniref:Flagellar protein FliL n=1 Tax=Hyphomonas neptunium (strain ATCC 15444) TaxID=228405 RepID=Q0C5K3_HYPNA|nr:hypothetical protein HNE_0259 [Hyphomonas neptunium ATCC 15444]